MVLYKKKIRKAQKGIKAPTFEAIDWIKGNLHEYVFGPLSNALGESTNEHLGTKTKNQVAVNKYDNQEGLLPTYRSDPYEITAGLKNLSIPQMFDKGYRTPAGQRNRWSNSIHAQGYMTTPTSVVDFIKTYVSDEATGNKNLRNSGTRKSRYRNDATKLYAGMPQTYDTFRKSKYADQFENPTVSIKNPSLEHQYILQAANHSDLFRLMSGTLQKEDGASNYIFDKNLLELEDSSDRKGGEKIYKHAFKDPNNIMWNATLGAGISDNGNYISYYDKWDLAPDVAEAAGSPYNIYNRLYISPKLAHEYAKFKKTPQHVMATDPEDNYSSDSAYVKDTYKKLFGDGKFSDNIKTLKESDKRMYNQTLGVNPTQSIYLIQQYGEDGYNQIMDNIENEMIKMYSADNEI